MLCKRDCMAQAVEGSLTWTYVCDNDRLMALAVMRVRQAAVRTTNALAGVKCISRTPEHTRWKSQWSGVEQLPERQKQSGGLAVMGHGSSPYRRALSYAEEAGKDQQPAHSRHPWR